MHQWFYALVGNDQINAPWLDESLSFYLGMLYFEQYEPAAFENLKRIYFVEHNTPSGRIDGAVTQYAGENEYARSVYYRGAHMFHLLRERIGDDAFFAALKLYAERNAYGIAVKEDLITAFEQASGEELTLFFENHLAAPANSTE
jgi:aminopeptidase N